LFQARARWPPHRGRSVRRAPAGLIAPNELSGSPALGTNRRNWAPLGRRKPTTTKRTTMNHETILSAGSPAVGKTRFLVVANETVEKATLQEVTGSGADGAPRADVLVIAPALNS